MTCKKIGFTLESSIITVASFSKRLMKTDTTPGNDLRCFSIVDEHDEHVIPAKNCASVRSYTTFNAICCLQCHLG